MRPFCFNVTVSNKKREQASSQVNRKTHLEAPEQWVTIAMETVRWWLEDTSAASYTAFREYGTTASASTAKYRKHTVQ
jgi:hypothetical protein